MSLEFEFRRESRGVGVVALTGRLDAGAADAVKATLKRLAADGYRHLVVDLAGVPYVDSSGLGALIAALKATREAGGDFRIARPVAQVLYILQVSTLDRVLVPHGSVAAAVIGLG